MKELGINYSKLEKENQLQLVEIEKQKKEENKLNSKINELISKCSSYESQIIANKTLLDQTFSEIDDYKRRLKDIDSPNSKSQKQSKIKSLEQKLNESLRQLDEANKKNNSIQAQNNELIEKYEKVQREKMNLQEENSQIFSEKLKIETEMKSINTIHECETGKLVEKLHEMEMEREIEKSDMSKTRNKEMDLKQKIEDLEKMKTQYHNKYTEMKKLNKILKKKVSNVNY